MHTSLVFTQIVIQKVLTWVTMILSVISLGLRKESMVVQRLEEGMRTTICFPAQSKLQLQEPQLLLDNKARLLSTSSMVRWCWLTGWRMVRLENTWSGQG